VAELVVGVDEGSSSQYKCLGDNIDLNCVYCVVLNAELQNVLQEFQLARSIIALLQEDMNNICESESTR
jgi:Na+-translocating ferredoxin:NAD+ oxidoreductase RnfA subunit